MRFSLTLKLKERVFPLEYRKIILSYIKNALSNCNNGKYYDRFFGDAKQKDYCFSVIFSKPQFKKDTIKLINNEIKILFTTCDKNKTGLILFSAFITQKNKSFPLENDNFMVLQKITKQRQEVILNNRAIFKTAPGSGICVREHIKESNKDEYYVYSSEKFRKKIHDVVKYELINAGFTEEEAQDIEVNPIQCRTAVAKHYKRYIDISIGMIEIKSCRDVLQYLYDTGIGSRKSAGFGMLDLVTQDLQ